MHIVEVTEHVLELLRLLDYGLRLVGVGPQWLEEIAQPLARDATVVEALAVVEVGDLTEDDLQVVCMRLCEIASTTCERGEGALTQ